MAGTGLDEHHILLHDLSVRALELYRKRGGSVGSAATAICAYSTELSPVCLHAGTTRKLKLDRLGDFGGTDALFALLNVLFQVSFTRPDHAEAALLLQPAEGVVIGNAGGDAHPTGLGTGTPLCGLDQAVGPNHSWVWAKRVFQSVSGQGRANHRVILGLVAHPLLAAFPGQLDPPREGAVGAGQADVHAAQGHAAHRPVQAGALVLAAALEGLSAPVHSSSEDAGGPVFSRAHADLAVGRGAEVAKEALVRVAGVALRAQLAQLLGAHTAAAAAVQHETDAGRAPRRRRGRTRALAAAVLAGRRLRGGGGGQRAPPTRRPGPCPAPPALRARLRPGRRGAPGLPGRRGRAGAGRRRGLGPGRLQT